MDQIIDKFIEGSLKSAQIIFSTHYERRIMERELNRESIVNMIINEDYLDFYEDLNKKNNYLIHFPSDKPNYDIVVAITAQNDKIIVMTVYEKKKR